MTVNLRMDRLPDHAGAFLTLYFGFAIKYQNAFNSSADGLHAEISVTIIGFQSGDASTPILGVP